MARVVTARAGAGNRIEVTAGLHRVVLDGAPGGGDTDAGPSPVEMLLAAVAG